MVAGKRKKKKTTKIKKKKNERRTYRCKLTWEGWQRRRRGGRRHVTFQQPSNGRATWRQVGRWRFKLFLRDELADDRRLRKFVDGTFRGGGGGFLWKRVKTSREEAHLGFAWVRGRRGFGQEDGEERETRRKEEWRKGGPSLRGSLVERNMGKRRMSRPLMEARKTEKKGERNEGKRVKYERMKAENQQIRKSVQGMGCHIFRWSSLIRNGGPCDWRKKEKDGKMEHERVGVLGGLLIRVKVVRVLNSECPKNRKEKRGKYGEEWGTISAHREKRG